MMTGQNAKAAEVTASDSKTVTVDSLPDKLSLSEREQFLNAVADNIKLKENLKIAFNLFDKATTEITALRADNSVLRDKLDVFDKCVMLAKSF